MLVSMIQLLQAAEEGGYALPGFSMCNLETIQAVIEAAEELDSPVVLCFAHVFQVGSPPGYLESLIQYAGERSRVPVASLLDHGRTMEICSSAQAMLYDVGRLSIVAARHISPFMYESRKGA